MLSGLQFSHLPSGFICTNTGADVLKESKPGLAKGLKRYATLEPFFQFKVNEFVMVIKVSYMCYMNLMSGNLNYQLSKSRM